MYKIYYSRKVFALRNDHPSYNMHDGRRDVLQPPHGTTQTAVKIKKSSE